MMRLLRLGGSRITHQGRSSEAIEIITLTLERKTECGDHPSHSTFFLLTFCCLMLDSNYRYNGNILPLPLKEG